jgi:hypothetical protein
MEDGVDDIDTMFHWYHSIALSHYCFIVLVFMFESIDVIFGS